MTAGELEREAPRSAAEPHLRQVLGAAAVAAGLTLRRGPHGALTDEEARAAATAWDLAPAGDRAPASVVVLVDGLGLHQLEERRGHVPHLRDWLARAERSGGPGPAARTCLPSTTAAALTTLGTGALPGMTGMVGYSVRNPALGPGAVTEPDAAANLCLITWEGRVPSPQAWQDVPTLFERLGAGDGPQSPWRGTAPPIAVSVGPSRFAGSGLTQAALRGTTHRGADTLEDRPALAAAAVRSGSRLVYLYVGELDHAGHGYGWRSEQWLRQLERLDAAVGELTRRLPSGTRLILSADHGMIDTSARWQVDVSRDPALRRDVVALAGEPRFTHVHVREGDPELAQEVAQRWRAALGERALWVGTQEESEDLLGPLSARARTVVGDVVVAMAEQWVLVDPRVHSPAAMAMPGVHGSLTAAETTIPLLLAEA